MNEVKFSAIGGLNGFGTSKIGKSSSDFQKFLSAEMISAKTCEIPENLADYRCGVCFGAGMEAKFPPDDAPDYFKAAWHEITSKMDDEYRWVYLNDNFETALTYGYYYFVFDRKEGAAGYDSFNSRIKNLGCVGCFELAIKVQEQCWNDNVFGGNEKRFTDKMKQSLDDLREIMAKCLEFGDKSAIEQQIRMADIDFERSKRQILREADIWLKTYGNDLQTMSDEKFKALLHSVQPTFTKFQADGTILIVDSDSGDVLNRIKADVLQ